MKQIQARYKGFYPTAGLKVVLREKLLENYWVLNYGKDIKKKKLMRIKLYSIVSSDFVSH